MSETKPPKVEGREKKKKNTEEEEGPEYGVKEYPTEKEERISKGNEDMKKMKAPVSEEQATEDCLMYGHLMLQSRPSKVMPGLMRRSWKKMLIVLGRKETGGLGLLLYAPIGGGNTAGGNTASGNTKKGRKKKEKKAPRFKLRSVIALESGCDVRKVDDEKLTGGRSYCFEVLTSKLQMRFQANDEKERARWVNGLDEEFKTEIELHLHEQKVNMLVRGTKLVMHRLNDTPSHRENTGMSIPENGTDNNAAVASSGGKGSKSLLDPPVTSTTYFVKFNDIDSDLLLVREGAQTEEMQSMARSSRGASKNASRGASSRDLDRANTDRDHGGEEEKEEEKEEGKEEDGLDPLRKLHIPLINVQSVVAGTETPALKASGAYHFNCFSLVLKTPIEGLEFLGSSIGFEATKQSTRDEWVSALQAQVHQEASKPRPSSSAFAASARLRKKRPSVIGSILTRKAESRGNGSGSRTGEDDAIGSQSMSDQVPQDPSNTSPLSGSPSTSTEAKPAATDGFGNSSVAAGGFGEMFKSKVKIARDFPYGKCISLAISKSLGGKEVSDKLSPVQDLSNEAFDKKVQMKLELDPETGMEPVDSPTAKGAAGGKKKSKRKDTGSLKPVKYEFQEYAPGVFKELRKQFGISDLSFVESLSELAGDGMIGDGKSGMLFFFTRDRKYVLKTVKQNEMDLFLGKSMIEGYARHMLAYPDSLICRFLGLYKFKMGPKDNYRAINLVAMSNSFDTRLVLHEKYDLKGSTRNRWCKPKFGSVLKDLNFVGEIRIDSEDKKELLQQLKHDALLLESYNVMDYSLLLGVHKPPEDSAARSLGLMKIAEDEEIQKKTEDRAAAMVDAASTTPDQSGVNLTGLTKWQRDFGGIEGMNSNGKPEVYIMCVIDILQAYDLGKKAENMIKSRMGEEREISAIEPKAYANRFIAYCEKIIVGQDGLNEDIRTRRDALRDEKIQNKEELSRETEQAFKNEDDSKAKAGGTGGFVEKLEDGTEIEIQESGTQIQRYPNGTVVTAYPSGSVWQVNPDGSTIETAEDGTVTQKLADGSKIVQPPKEHSEIKSEQYSADGTHIVEKMDGTVIQTMPDGTIIEIDSMKNKRQQNPDGSFVEHLAKGAKRQTNPDGVVLLIMENGDTVQTDPSGTVITKYADGKQVQEEPDGTKMTTFAETGDQFQEFSNGSTVEIRKSDGYLKQTNADGSVVECFQDGKRVYTPTDGGEPTVTYPKNE